MASPDGKLFVALGDGTSRDLLRIMARERVPLSQAALGSLVGANASTISRRMADLEDLGLVARKSSHAPYQLKFPGETRAVLKAVNCLATAVLRRDLDELAIQLDELGDTKDRTGDGT
ncbi:winged helix-turn-helix domain-containing protein [Baekduia sp. Peel2402]|uniref:winged helix-turn-helix domain-containing protein n=1 Tax=Baekduia sp. Peel2402 TaxID=3458296 RepID=UPI00403E60EE